MAEDRVSIYSVSLYEKEGAKYRIRVEAVSKELKSTLLDMFRSGNVDISASNGSLIISPGVGPAEEDLSEKDAAYIDETRAITVGFQDGFVDLTYEENDRPPRDFTPDEYAEDAQCNRIHDWAQNMGFDVGTPSVWLAFAETLQRRLAEALFKEVKADLVFVLDMRQLIGHIYGSETCQVHCGCTALLIDPDASGDDHSAVFKVPEEFISFGLEGLFPCQFDEFPTISEVNDPDFVLRNPRDEEDDW